MIDLRSDTVTHPTLAMREAMARAKVGDDVFGEDPTVNRLEELAAEMLGKDAALFVSSGTMGNFVALLTHCGRGDEIIVGDQSHIFTSEQGGAAVLGGIAMYPVRNQADGTMRLDEIRGAIRADDVHFPSTRLICVENTQMRMNGAPLAIEYLEQVREIADAHKLKIHTDGARIFNAAVALNVNVKALARYSDTVQFCLSKGLSAPVGSMLVGSREFIQEARRARKLVGGGMRQAGVIAAAGIVALETMVDRLAEDHANAKYLAEQLADVAGIELDPATVKTNMVIFGLAPNGIKAPQLAERVKHAGVLLQPRGEFKLRAATHYGITRADVETALHAIRHALD
ncbi:MAG: low-specificity L-threonine aldolase [Chloroflexota bacterium]|nr:MAG: low-specificity L-threonine aldolase [Chloroflexota bacterium]